MFSTIFEFLLGTLLIFTSNIFKDDLVVHRQFIRLYRCRCHHDYALGCVWFSTLRFGVLLMVFSSFWSRRMLQLYYFNRWFTSKAGLRTLLIKIYVRSFEYQVALFRVTIIAAESRRIYSFDHMWLYLRLVKIDLRWLEFEAGRVQCFLINI